MSVDSRQKKDERFPPHNVELLVARHIKALRGELPCSGQSLSPSQPVHESPSISRTTSERGGSARGPSRTNKVAAERSLPHRKPVDLQYVRRETTSSRARLDELAAERSSRRHEHQDLHKGPECSSDDNGCPEFFEKLHTTVREPPKPPPVSRTQAEPARRKDYAARHDGKEILVAISPEAASQRFHDSETARRKQQRQQQEASESEAVKKFRGPPLKKDVMDRLVKRLADESQERQVSSLESLREQYFKKYSADNVPLKSAPRSVIPSVT